MDVYFLAELKWLLAYLFMKLCWEAGQVRKGAQGAPLAPLKSSWQSCINSQTSETEASSFFVIQSLYSAGDVKSGMI